MDSPKGLEGKMIEYILVNDSAQENKKFFSFKTTVLIGVVLLSFVYLQASFPGFLLATDSVFLEKIASERTQNGTAFFSSMTKLGDILVISSLGILCFIIFLFKRKGAIPGFLLSLFGTGASVFLLKLLIDRPRPPEDLSLLLLNPPSFPSGHSAFAMVFYGFLIFAFISRLKNFLPRFLIGVIGALLIMTIASSRIYLGVHYPLDVVGGLLLGSLWLIFGIRATRSIEKLE